MLEVPRREEPTEFSGGKASHCRPCAVQSQRDYRARHPERVAARRKAIYDATREDQIRRAVEWAERQKTRDPIGWMLNHKRANARIDGVEFTITKADLVMPEVCPVLGVRLAAVGSSSDWSPSLDRFDPTKGYIPGNVRIISKRANTLKNNGTAEEHERIAAWMRSVDAAGSTAA